MEPIAPEQRRAGEQRVFEAYTAALTQAGELPAPDWTPVWPLQDGHVRWTEVHGVFVDETWLEGAWPDTVIVIVYRLAGQPECRFLSDVPIWDLDSFDQPEPRERECFAVNFIETVVKRPRAAGSPDRTVVTGRHMPFSKTLPALVEGRIPLTPEERERARQALALFRGDGG